MTVLIASELGAADLALLARPEPARPARAVAARRTAAEPASPGLIVGQPVQFARSPGHLARPAGRSASPLRPLRWLTAPAG